MEGNNDDADSGTGGDQEDTEDVYIPGQKLEDGEELECDESAYVMLHQAHTGAPCLSFDVIPDDLGDARETFPMSCYMVSGTQAARAHVNSLIVMKMSNLHRTSKEKDSDMESDLSDEDSDVEEDDEKKPKMACALIKHQGCVNRVRCTRFNNTTFAASWSELGRVNIYNLNEQLQAVEDKNALKAYETGHGSDLAKPVFSFNGHQQEGFALDWSQAMPGFLASGDCRKDIHIWKPNEATWIVDQRPLQGHTASVEDLQWSPNERNVLASCSVDKSIRIWDVRANPAKACMLTCDNSHESDVNVISWNQNEPFIASGGDDGVLNIWDLRQFQNKTPIATFKHHTNHITTVEWHPRDSTVLASGGDDDQIALWDLALERDDNAEDQKSEKLKNLPPQLLFIHQGQKEIKELHWHPQLPGVILSTAHTGFNIFRTISV